MSHRNNQITVIYIVGTGRSGSTLLTTVLGQVPGIFPVGEIDYLSEININNQLCGCGQRFTECEFWNNLEFQGKRGLQNFPFGKHKLLRNKLEKTSNIPLFLFRGIPIFNHELEKYEDLLEELYNSISKSSKNNIIIDSSKNLSRLFILRRIKNINLVVVHLIRNPRAVAYSWTKHYVRPEVVNDIEFMHRYNPLRVAFRWQYKNILLNISKGLFRNYFRLFYEDFVRSPQETLQSLLSLVDNIDKDIGFIKGNQILKQKENHTLSGNPMRFNQGNIRIEADNEWRRKLSPGNKLLVSMITWPVEFLYDFGGKYQI